MSAAPWKTTRDQKPFGFRVVIERRHNGSRENHIFKAKTSQRAIAVKAAEYKHGFIRLLSVFALTREEWEREFGAPAKVATGASR